jgi:hypothetical protein
VILKNFASGVLSAPITSGSSSITVNSGHTLPSNVGTFTAIIWNNTSYTSPSLDPNAEIVLGSYNSVNNYNITRAQESTLAVSHSAGALIGLYVTAGVLQGLFPIPAFGVVANSSQSLSSSSPVQVTTFGSPVFDSNSNFSSNTFTPSVAGTYLISASIAIESSGGAGIGYAFSLYKNGSQISEDYRESDTNDNYVYLHIANFPVIMNGSTDNLQLYVTGNNGSTVIDTGSTYFSGFRIY